MLSTSCHVREATEYARSSWCRCEIGVGVVWKVCLVGCGSDLSDAERQANSVPRSYIIGYLFIFIPYHLILHMNLLRDRCRFAFILFWLPPSSYCVHIC